MGADASGRAVKKSFYGRTRQEALDKHAQWTREHPEGPPPVEQQSPLNDLLAEWVETCIKPPAGKVGTYEDYLSKIRLHIAPTIGQVVLYEVRTSRINKWLRELFEATGKGRTVEKCHQIVRAALQYAVDNEILERNPATNARVPQFQRRREQRLSLEQAHALVEAAYGRLHLSEDARQLAARATGVHAPSVRFSPRLGLLYELAVFAGLRRGELLALRYGDLVGDELHVSRQVDDEGREHPYTKTDSSHRRVPVGEFLDAWRAHRVAQQAEGHGEAWRPDGLVFPTSEGTIMRTSNLSRHFKQVLAAAGLPPIRFHDLRHTAASLMIDAGAAPTSVSRVLGHRSPRMVMERYSHGDEQGARDAVRASRRRAGGGGGGR